MNNDITINVPVIISEENILDIITTAIEGGIGYWATLCNDDPNYVATYKKLKANKKKDEVVYFCDIIYDMMLNNLPVKFIDSEEEGYKDPFGNTGVEDDEWKLTFDKFKNGIKLYCQHRGNIVKNIDYCEFDADEADCVFQYALFNDIIFG